MKEFATFPEMLEGICASYESPGSLNCRKAGGWVSVSNDDILTRVRYLALGLDLIGIKKGDGVGIMGFPSPSWIIADLAIMSIGAVTVPFFPSEPNETRSYKISDADLHHIFLLDEQAHTEILPHKDAFKSLIFDGKAQSGFLCLDDVVESGHKDDFLHNERYMTISSCVKPDDLSTIYYTSGSTGVPKGVELTHANIISQIKAAQIRIPLLRSDTALSCLPLAHSFERFMVYYYMASGVSVYFNSDIHCLMDDMGEVKPSIIGLVPRILEKVYMKFRDKVEGGSRLTKCIGMMSVKWAFQREPDRDRAGWKGVVASVLVFRKMRRALGGGLRVVITGSAALPPDLYRFFINAGVPVYQGYGLTEASPVLSANAPSAHKIGTVGLPFPGVDIRIAADGEITARGPNIMQGYHKQPDLSSEAVDPDGWLQTGDLGEIDDDGYLSITGRKKDLLKSSCGEYVAPVPIEHSLCQSPHIESAVVIGEGKPFVTCLIFPVTILTVGQRRDVGEAVAKLNETLEHWEQIREFRIVYDDMTIANGMLTPTMKIRRHMVLKKYSRQISQMYDDEQHESGN